MGRRPPITRRTDTLFPYTTLCRSISRERSSVRERTETNCDNKSVDAWPSGGHLIGMARLRPLLLMVPAASLAACAVGPNYRPASSGALRVPAQFSVAADARAQADLSAGCERFADPPLTRLVEQARAANPHVAQAMSGLSAVQP